MGGIRENQSAGIERERRIVEINDKSGGMQGKI